MRSIVSSRVIRARGRLVVEEADTVSSCDTTVGGGCRKEEVNNNYIIQNNSINYLKVSTFEGLPFDLPPCDIYSKRIKWRYGLCAPSDSDT